MRDFALATYARDLRDPKFIPATRTEAGAGDS